MASVANHALSCPSYGALMHGVVDSPSTSRGGGGLLALKRSSSRQQRGRVVGGVRAAAAASGYTLLDSSPRVDLDCIVAEKPGLLALSSDLDWQQSVSELRQQALSGLRAHQEMALARLFAFLDSRLHDHVVERVLQPSLVAPGEDLQDELGVRIRVQDLRLQATLQATEELANKVDSSFDWESEVAELRHCVAIQNRAELEQKLLSSWESSRKSMDEDTNRLHDEALKTNHTDDEYLTLFPDEKPEEVVKEEEEEKSFEISGTWWTLGVLAGLFGAQTMSAIAADDSVTAAITAATKEAPGWVAPSVLGFPVVSYFLFTLYRNKVNPYAKLTDWVFGLVAMAILGNIVLIATVGVRLY